MILVFADFFAGAMPDWEAPTGGYLLMACSTSGRAAGLGVMRWIENIETAGQSHLILCSKSALDA